MRFIAYAIVAWVVLTVFTTVFAASAKSNEVRVLSKWLWLLIVLFVPVIGAILYITIGRPITEKPTSSLAPDDDPEFLRRLAERLKNENDEPKND